MAGMLFYQPASFGDAINLHPRHFFQYVQEYPAQFELIAADGAHPQLDPQAPPTVICRIALGMLCAKGLPHPFNIFQCPQNPAHALEVARAGLELARWVFGGRSHLIRREAIE